MDLRERIVDRVTRMRRYADPGGFAL